MDGLLDLFKSPEEYEAEALQRVDRNDMVGAVRLFSKAIGAYGAKTPVQPIYNRGLCYVHMQQMQAALDDFNRCLQIKKTYEPALLSRSRLFLYFGQYGLCISDCDELLKLNERNSKALVNKGAALHERGQFTEAYHMYIAALNADPEDNLALRNLNRVVIDEPTLPMPAEAAMQIGAWPI